MHLCSIPKILHTYCCQHSLRRRRNKEEESEPELRARQVLEAAIGLDMATALDALNRSSALPFSLSLVKIHVHTEHEVHITLGDAHTKTDGRALRPDGMDTARTRIDAITEFLLPRLAWGDVRALFLIEEPRRVPLHAVLAS